MPTAPSERDDQRRRIAVLAARMIAEDGVNTTTPKPSSRLPSNWD